MDTKSHQQLILQELAASNIHPSARDPYFDDFVKLALKIAGVPVAVIFFGAANKLIKAVAGDSEYPESKTNLICSLINQRKIYTEAEDLLRYDQFRFSAVLLEDPIVRFIGKEPILSKNGLILGSICLMDQRPRKMTAEQIRQLDVLSRLITRHIEYMKSRT